MKNGESGVENVWECVGGSIERVEKGSGEGLRVRGRVKRAC